MESGPTALFTKWMCVGSGWLDTIAECSFFFGCVYCGGGLFFQMSGRMEKYFHVPSLFLYSFLHIDDIDISSFLLEEGPLYKRSPFCNFRDFNLFTL